jgi:hypothetical protein
MLCLLSYVPMRAQQSVLAAGGSLSRSGVACTVSIGEVFTSLYLPSARPSLAFGVTRPATKDEMTANGNTDNGGDDDDDDDGGNNNGNGDDDDDNGNNGNGDDDDGGNGSGNNGNGNGDDDDGTAISPVESTPVIQARYDPPTQSVCIRFGTAAHMPRTCRVYALNGALRQTATLPDSPESAVSLSGMASGFYLLHISAGNDLLTTKIIKQ